MSVDTVKRIEGGRRELGQYEREPLLEAIADLCGLPPQFFSMDFRVLEILPDSASLEDVKVFGTNEEGQVAFAQIGGEGNEHVLLQDIVARLGRIEAAVSEPLRDQRDTINELGEVAGHSDAPPTDQHTAPESDDPESPAEADRPPSP